MVKKAVENIEKRIEYLLSSNVNLNSKTLFVSHQLELTMINMVVYNTTADNKCTQKCYMCELPPKDFNNMDLVLAQQTDDSN